MDIGECYLILGLDKGATEEEIKSAYRKLAKQYHPDKTQGDEFLARMFKKINTAYHILSEALGYEEPFAAKNSAPDYNNNPVLRQWIGDFQKAQQGVLAEQYNLSKTQYIQKINYLSVTNLFKIIGGLVLITVFFYPERLKSKNGQPLKDNRHGWVLKDQVNLYQKPDVKGRVLINLKPGDQLDSIGETEYYYKVRLDSGKTKISGYILKNKTWD